MINGFWINQTCNLEIIIRHKPQVWFDWGFIISLVTFISVLWTISSMTGERRKIKKRDRKKD
ncbi:MAG TPA: hypothetical protein ENH28_04280 [Euryarchaeota archaeon]|nr:hypothetical protein [Euryarchaeota archaeon]